MTMTPMFQALPKPINPGEKIEDNTDGWRPRLLSKKGNDQYMLVGMQGLD